MGRFSELDKRDIIVLAVVFIVLLAFNIAVIGKTLADAQRDSRESAELNAKVCVGELKGDFERGVFATEALEQVVVDDNGEINHFETVAESLMQDFIGSIQIAPDGTVTNIYPMEGNEAGLIDLMNDPDRGPVVRYGRDNDEITFQGPFDLKQGGVGIAVRNPVFITDDAGNRSFWGFTIVIIKSPAIFQETFDALEAFGYDYRLSTTTSPLSDEVKLVDSSTDTLIDPVSIEFTEGACSWVLEVEPRSGWTIGEEEILVCISGSLAVLLLTVMAAMLLMMHAHRRRLHELVITDHLTGVLNRSGFVQQVHDFFRNNPQGPATQAFLDIDDFKIVNDLYGHEVGDEALINLAHNLKTAVGDAGIVARTGGDEFGIFFPGMTAEQAETYIRAASEQDQTFTTSQGKTYDYTISIGYADFPAQANTVSSLARNVDSALYNVKMNGKGNCQRFEPGMIKQSRQQFGFTQGELLKEIPGACFICHADDAHILYANDELIELLECENYEDFNRFTLGLFQNMVYPDDYNRVMAVRNEKLAYAGEGETVSCRFRIITKKGHTRNMVAHARHKHHDLFGELLFVMSLDVDAE